MDMTCWSKITLRCVSTAVKNAPPSDYGRRVSRTQRRSMSNAFLEECRSQKAARRGDR